MNDLITVIITSYNYERYVAKAIDSVFLQSYPNLELIVIDDGSTDDSVKVIEESLKKQTRKLPVRLIARENRGVVKTRNEGMGLAEGEYFIFLDADDFFSSDFLKDIHAVAVKSRADVVYPNWHVFDEVGKTDYLTDYPDFSIKNLQLQKLHVSSESLVKCSAIEGFDFQSEEVAEDWDFFNRLALAGRKFQLGKYCYINYLVKNTGRGMKNKASEDLVHFGKLLEKWAEIYGQKKVVKPEELYLSKFEEQAEDLAVVRKINQLNSYQAQDLQEQRDINNALRFSLAYRLGHVMLYPLRLLRHPKRLAQLPLVVGKLAKRAWAKFSPKLATVRVKALRRGRAKARRQNNVENPRRFLIYVIYESQERLQDYKLIFLKALVPFAEEVVTVINGELDPRDIAELSKYGRVESRENRGYDTAAFKYGVQKFAKDYASFDELLLVNDTNIGPFSDLSLVFDKMAKKDVEFWGMAFGDPQPDFTGYNKYGTIPEHLQSYFMLIRKSMFKTQAFKDYWNNLGETDSREKAIGLHETVFTKHFGDMGYTYDSFGDQNVGTHMYSKPLTVLTKYQFPIIKYTSLERDTDEKMAWTGRNERTEVPDLVDYLEKETDYPMEVINKIREDIHNKPHEPYILLIDGVENQIPQCTRYRVENKAEQLRSLGLKVITIPASSIVNNFYLAEYASDIIIYRAGYNDWLGNLYFMARKAGKRVYFDVDDLVIDTAYTDQLEYTQTLSPLEKTAYDKGVGGYQRMMLLADAVITSTSDLAQELQKYHPNVLLNRNLASEALVSFSEAALDERKEQSPTVKMAYFSGSIVHNENFKLISSAIADLLKKHKYLELHIIGYLDLTDQLQAYADQIKRHDYVDWTGLPSLMSQVDINLAPLVDNVFNRAKSEIKWLEAALVKVPTAASNIGAFSEMIDDRVTGLLINDEEWFEKLDLLIQDSQLRQKLAESAYQKVHQDCLLYKKHDEMTRKIEGNHELL